MKSVDKLLKKYKAFPEPAKAALWFTICSILQRGIQFIVVPIYTRVLTTTEYGYYSVFTSWTEIIMIFCTLNLFYNSYNVGLTRFDKDNDRFTSSLLGVCYILTSLCFIIYLIFRERFNSFFGMTTALCICMFIHLFIMSSYQFWAAKQRYEYKYKLVIFATLCLAIGTPVLALISIVFMRNHCLAVVGSKVFVEVFLGIPALIVIVKRGKTLFNQIYWKYSLKNNIPLVPYYLSQIILNHSDRLMINNFCGTAKAGIYSVAYSAAMLLTMINTAMNNSVIPWKFKKLKNRDITGIHEVTFSLMLLVMGMNAVLVALAPEALAILASKEYYEAVWIIPPVACSAFLLFVSQQFINIEFYYEENKFAAYSSILVAVLNIVLNYICIPKFGYIIAGYTTLFSYLIFTLIHYIAMRYVCKKHMDGLTIWKIKDIVLITLFLLIFSAIMLLGYKGYLLRYATVIIILSIIIVKRNEIIKIIRFKR